MTTQTKPVTPPAATSAEELDHVYCCDRDRGLCGADLTGMQEIPGAPATCVVCADLDESDTPCGPDCACAIGQAAALEDEEA